MTPSELRELADALAKGTHFVDSPELHAAMQNAADYLRACAEERPDGWRLVPAEPTEAMKSAGGHVNSEWLNDDAPLYESRYAMPMDGVWSAMLAAAPAAPQAEPVSDPRPCTCHPDDSPPVPCAQQYALNECRAVHGEPTEAQIEARDALLDFISENGTASEGVQHYLDRYVRAALAAKE